MTEQKRIKVGDYWADVHSETRYAFFMDSAGKTIGKTAEHPAVLTKPAIEALRTQAEREGFDKVVLVLSRYVGYSLRHVMRRRTGTISTTTTHQLKGGVWTKTVATKNETY